MTIPAAGAGALFRPEIPPTPAACAPDTETVAIAKTAIAAAIIDFNLMSALQFIIVDGGFLSSIVLGLGGEG